MFKICVSEVEASIKVQQLFLLQERLKHIINGDSSSPVRIGSNIMLLKVFTFIVLHIAQNVNQWKYVYTYIKYTLVYYTGALLKHSFMCVYAYIHTSLKMLCCLGFWVWRLMLSQVALYLGDLFSYSLKYFQSHVLGMLCISLI